MDLFALTETVKPDTVGPPSDLYINARQRNDEVLEGGRTFRVTPQTAGRLAATQFLDNNVGK
jgi:hypothetical protein